MENNAQMILFYYIKKVDDKKHGVKFDKDKISYKGHTFDAILSKKVRERIKDEMQKRSLQLPLLISVSADPAKEHYFTKPKSYDYTDKSTGVIERKTKTALTLLDYISLAQGQYAPHKSLDDIVDEIDGDIDED